MSFPYLPLFVDDYEAATAHLTLVEDGIYTRLLRLCWRTPGCRIPADIDWIARKIRVSNGAELAALKAVLKEFFITRRGYISSKRLSAEHERIRVSVQKRKEAGKSGGEAKSRKNKDNIPSNATAMPQHPYPYPNPDVKAEAFTPRGAREKPKGFVVVRKTTDAMNDVIQEIRQNDSSRTGIGSESLGGDVPMLPAIGSR